jgi:hypothetical protein
MILFLVLSWLCSALCSLSRPVSLCSLFLVLALLCSLFLVLSWLCSALCSLSCPGSALCAPCSGDGRYGFGRWLTDSQFVAIASREEAGGAGESAVRSLLG